MALNKTRLGAAMKAAIDGVADKNDRTALFEALADAIVTEFQAFAQVNSTVAVASVTGVTPGGGVSGAGLGTAIGTIL